jgi:tight adherence protein B
MTRRRLACCLAAVLAIAASAGPAAAQEGPQLAEAGGVAFPDRAYVLTLPADTALDSSRLVVRENGEEVSNLSVVPAGAAAGAFAVVLVIDASQSMAGAPIEGAVAAARAFVDQRNPNQRIALVAFNSEAHVLLPFSTSQATIEAALAEPPELAKETHIYDAVATAMGLLKQAKVSAGSIIVLSDGTDTGSTVALEKVAEKAASDHVRIFTVGLRSPSFTPEALERLADGAGGTFAEATSAADLEPIFDALGSQLASEFLLRYRSRSGPDREVKVAVVVNGIDGVATSDYSSPALADGPQPPFHRSATERFLRSPAGMLAAALGSAFFVALAFGVLVRRRPRTLRGRLAEFVSVPQEGDGDERGRSDLVLGAAERPFEDARWWKRFKEELEIAGIKVSPAQIVLWTVVGTLVAMWLLYTVGGTPLFAVFGLGVPLLVRSLIKSKLERQRRLFAEQLPDNLQVLSSALRAGHSLVGALSVVVDDCPPPSRAEFRRVIADEQLGVPLQDAFDVVVRRMDSRDLEQVALVAALQQETGGNTAEVLDRVAETVRSRGELRRLVKTLTTQGRMSRWIVSFLPVGLLVLISLINPEYMEPLYTHPTGRILLGFAAVMVVAGSLLIKRIVNIKI